MALAVSWRHAMPRQAASATAPAWAVPRRSSRAALRAGARRDQRTPSGKAITRHRRESFGFSLAFFGRIESRGPHGLCRCGRSGQSDGWCDDPGARPTTGSVSLPCRGCHEKLWRADRLYDLVIVLDYNIRPRRKNRGSAIFLHCARPDFAPTEGCVALRPDDLRKLLPRLAKKVGLTIR